jgi:PTS system nitrogen regulatory IIA component
MLMSKILVPQAVMTLSGVASKKRMMQEITDRAERVYGLDATLVLPALIEREALGPTGVGRGVALPHARLSGLEDIRGLFVRLDKPVNYDAVDRQPVDLVFALFAPDGNGVDHLKALATVSRVLRDPSFCSALRANDDANKLYALMTSDETSRAAQSAA